MMEGQRSGRDDAMDINELTHDLNNLLAVISTSLDLLSTDGPDDPDSLELIAVAREACQRAGELTARAVRPPD